MSSQTVSRRPRPRRQPAQQKRTQEVKENSHEEKNNEDVMLQNDSAEETVLSSTPSHSSPRRRLVSHHNSPRRKFERSPVRRTHPAMPRPPLQGSSSPPPPPPSSLSPELSPKTRLKGFAQEKPREFPHLPEDNNSHHTSSRPKERGRRRAIGKLTIRIDQLKAENLMPVTHHIPVEIHPDSFKNIGETLVNTLKQPTNLTRAVLKAPDALIKTPANIVSKTSDALKKSADAFVQLHYFDYGWKSGPKTSIQKRTCSPEWPDDVLEMQLGADAARALLKSGERLELRLWSHDVVAGDVFLGSTLIPVLSKEKHKTATYRVLKRSPNDCSLQSHHVTGELTARVSLHAEAMVELHRGDLFPLDQSKITLGVSCHKSNLESSVVVFNRQGQVMWTECAYNNNCATDSLNLSYNDSGSKDLLYYHMDRIIIDLNLKNLPDEATALFVVVYVPSHDASLQVRILETESKVAVAHYAPRSLKESHSVILARLARDSRGWNMAPVGEIFARVREIGSLLPVMNKFMQDLVTGPSSNVAAKAVLCKQKPIFLSSDTEQWKLCISWNEKENNDESIGTFTTNALLLDGDFHVMDQVDATVDSSRRGGVTCKRGWSPRRSEKFEDFLVEKIENINNQRENYEMDDFTEEFDMNLSKLSARVSHVCFNIVLPSKANKVDVSAIEKVSLQLHDESRHTEFARFESPVQSESRLLVACFSRHDKDPQGRWVFEVASVATSRSEMGKQWKSFFTENEHSDPYEIVPQDNEEMNLESRNMPTLTVLNPKPATISDENLLRSLG